MKTHLSHIMPVWRASEILTRPIVHRIVRTLLSLRRNSNPSSSGDLTGELENLVDALFFKPLHEIVSSPMAGEAPVPPGIEGAMNKWLKTRQLALDKATLIQFLVPMNVHPHSGSSGHMGLFDCFVYTLQGHSSSSSSSYYGGAMGQLVLLPDVLIYLAVCKQYRDFQKEQARIRAQATAVKDEERVASSDHDKIIVTMALLAYRMYDSYQKKGNVARDTVHRYMTDVHGENSYKEPKAQALLDQIFDDTIHAAGWLQKSISESTFCARILSTHIGRPHLLLDWMANLACAMIPPTEDIPLSIAAFLETMEQKPRSLCDIYSLADSRIFEIKRRFHSMVQSKSEVIHGDPMGSAADCNGNGPSSTSLEQPSESLNQPKQGISMKAFCRALSSENEELGHGGYMQESLAKLVFAGVASSSSSEQNGYDLDTEGKISYLTLFDVLKFGCTAVRQNKSMDESTDLPLLRFLYRVFQHDENSGNNSTQFSSDRGNMTDSKGVMTRFHVARMLVELMDFSDFRLERDSPRDMDLSPEDNIQIVKSLREPLEESIIDVEECVFQGLMPPTESETSTVTLREIVDLVLEDTSVPNQMNFDEFCKWNETRFSEKGPPSRLGQLMLELRIVAGVLFGIPPTLASMEIALVAELERRHRSRYPQTEVSRRGPRGTVWNIIDSAWFGDWTNLVKQASGTPSDGNDGRGVKDGALVRGLRRISNTGLLSENGSLALRSDIRWKHDYDILPPMSWSALQAWYDGGPPIHRTVVKYVSSSGTASPHTKTPRIMTENEIELHPLFISIYMCDAASRGDARPFQQNYQVSRVSPVGVLLVQLCRELEINLSSARIWMLSAEPGTAEERSSSPDWILDLDSSISDQRKKRNTTDSSRMSLLLEVKDDKTGLWPRGIDGKEWAFKKRSEEDRVFPEIGDGVVGLYNMGNTCYLNSPIQCISHTPIFREYFTSRAYLKDINTTNPLGYEGHLAQVTAILINSLWKRFGNQSSTTGHMKRITTPGSYAPVNSPALTPKTFKDSLAKFNDHFQGNEQHDAQEFLTFLLGGLSEDLNRIVEKPYIEAPDSDGRPDSELADIWWANHLKREMSIVVAFFTGQFKSLLTCRTCLYESARFEPYLYLQLPLPEDDYLAVSLILYARRGGGEPMKYCVRVHVDGTLGDVLIALAKVLVDEEIEESANSNEQPEKSVDDIEQVYQDRAGDLAVVDMKDCYISKIAPKSWVLRDLQNKDSGELPLLHIFELDPIPASGAVGEPEDKTLGNGNDNEQLNNGETNHAQRNVAFLAVSQRRSELITHDYLHPLGHRLIGVPLLIRVNNFSSCTGCALYDIIARKIRDFVPKSALRFLSESAMKSETQHMDESVTAETRTYTDTEDVSGGPVPRYGFRLRITTRDGKRCPSCPWYECCIGCLIYDNDKTTDVMDGDSIAVDWHFAVDVATSGFGMRPYAGDPVVSQPQQARARQAMVNLKCHRSCGTGERKSMHAGSVTLEDCLDAFAKEEKIPEAYCSRCKDFRVQTKRMSLWRLPPVVIIHLKRFQFTQHMRRKLRDLVVFPIEGLDLSRIMAEESKGSTKSEKDTSAISNDALESELAEEKVDEDGDEPSEKQSIKDDGRSEKLYDLYGVVHHQGALSGGHYVASLKSEIDGQWRLYNDAQIYEIHARDVVDSSAYILFYMRRDVRNAKLSDFWDVRDGAGVSEEEIDKMIKEKAGRCVIS
ncbi:ubiquitin carboxyl-terminal hydrolase 6/32 [Fistulifera solaris]|uniref:ubiquitinyl hydrolase 1 n=1 Tax=Fistulifera solaris TaxID=1519565 RepID=A0A1Z5KGQ9_FISSO|nr:ubiquitin carboxyl-terminal hydrolase 6/32 [Fistulifera solaris]|eukprot:GAX25397.1 ubiquitin carboxyl-terminal hydrolase 6/32 [Fistulifera solaris]